MMDQEQALRNLARERRMIESFIRSIVADAHLVEDVIQEVYIVVAQRHGDFADGTNFGAWVREIARRTALHQLRRAGRPAAALEPRTLDALEASFDVPAETWEDERRALRRCVEKLPEESLRVLDLRYVSDAPLAEIAASVGRSVDGVKALLKRLRQKLAECAEARLAGPEGETA
jgi:RNA polymerase sigma-70 factor (ECF subfamily)